MSRHFATALTLTVVLPTAAAHAQTVPAPANPARIEDRFKAPEPPHSAPRIEVSDAESLIPPSLADQTRFQLKAVVIEGSSVFSTADLEPLYTALIGTEVSLADIFRLRDAVTVQYRRKGYLLSKAILPPQEIVDGIVHIRVIEGYIDRVSIEGNVRDRRGLIAAMANRITKSRPLRAADLERYVLLISDLPGLHIRTVIRPSPEHTGAAELVIIGDRKLVAGFLEADNRGSVAIGPEEFSAGLEFDSVLGLDEQTSILAAATAQTSELAYVALRHDEVLNPEGLILSLRGSYNRSHPGASLAPLSPHGKGEMASIFLSAPVIRSRSHSLTVSGGFTYQNSSLDLLSVRFNEDRVRFLSFGLTYDFADTAIGDLMPARTVLRVRIDQGLNILNPTKTGSANLSRLNGRSDFTLFNAEAARLQSLLPRISLALAVSGQLAITPLLVSQQFGLGGQRFGRGYEPSEVIGDHGLGLSLEARYDAPALGTKLQPELYTFLDYGRVWTTRPLPGQRRQESLSSAGIGLRLDLGHRLHVDVALAKPLNRAVASRGNKDVRPLFTVSTTF